MAEIEKPPEGIEPSEGLNNIHSDVSTHIADVYQKLGRILARKVFYKIRDSKISFAACDGLEDVRFNRDERIALMKIFTDAGIFRFRPFYGWYLVPEAGTRMKEEGVLK